VAVLGPGAIGGFLSALFFQKNIPVTCIAKEETAEIISQNGIRLESSAFGDFIAHPEVVTYLDKAPDILFITTKATTLSDALKRVDPGFLTDAVIIPFLNGIEHMELLRSVYGKRVVAATIGNVEVKKVSADHIIHSTPSAVIELASGGDIPDLYFQTLVSPSS
jgi:2-dehydropantoate 2-reductase